MRRCTDPGAGGASGDRLVPARHQRRLAKWTLQLGLAVSVAAAQGANLKLTIAVTPIVIMSVTDASGTTIKSSGSNLASVTIPIASYGTQRLTAMADAAGQASDRGCAMAARLTASGAKIRINNRELSDSRDSIVSEATAYGTAITLAIDAVPPQGRNVAPPSLVLSCRAQ